MQSDRLEADKPLRVPSHSQTGLFRIMGGVKDITVLLESHVLAFHQEKLCILVVFVSLGVYSLVRIHPSWFTISQTNLT